MDFWKDELTEEETQRLVDRVVDEISKRGLETPAILAFEMHKPLAGVAGASSVLFAPFMVPFLGFDAVNDYGRLLAKRENIDRIVDQLDRGRREKGSKLPGPGETTDHKEASCTT